MKQTSWISVVLLVVIVSLVMVSCSPFSKQKPSKMNADTILKIKTGYETYQFEGMIQVSTDLPSYSLTTMKTLATKQNIEISWNGKYQKAPFQMEADLMILTTIQGTETEIPVTLIATDHDIYLSSPAFTQDRFIHQDLDGYFSDSLSSISNTLSNMLLYQLQEISKEKTTASSLTFLLDKEDIDTVLQQLLFYDIPKYIDFTHHDSAQSVLAEIKTQRDNYLDNRDPFYQLLSVKDAEMKWQLSDEETLEQSWKYELSFDDHSQQGSISITGNQRYRDANEEVVFVHRIPNSNQLLPLNDMITLINMFGK